MFSNCRMMSQLKKRDRKIKVYAYALYAYARARAYTQVCVLDIECVLLL